MDIQMASTPREIGAVLKHARESLNYSLADLSEACGLPSEEIVAVEAGTTKVPDHATRIALSLGVKLG